MIGIVILHYLAFDMTVQCVEQVKKIISHAEIVIVDNASPNGTGLKLMKHFEQDEYVTVLLNPMNDGFARGNNVGYEYLKARYDMDYIIVMNNDVLIKQDGFDEILQEVYQKTRFDVLGPDIYNTVLKCHQNPSRLSTMELNEVKDWIDRFQKVEDHYFISYIKMKICDIRDLIIPKPKETINRLIQHDNPVLHGACYVFSANYIKKRQHAFNPGTFLYGEEDILAVECRRNNLKMVYSPELKVEHLEDVSTNMSFKNNYTKTRMKNKQMLKSYKLLYDLMRNE